MIKIIANDNNYKIENILTQKNSCLQKVKFQFFFFLSLSKVAVLKINQVMRPIQQETPTFKKQ